MHRAEVPNRLLTAGTRHVLKLVSLDQTMRPTRAAMIGDLSAAIPCKTGSLAIETPRLPGGQQWVRRRLPSGPAIKPIGSSASPETDKAAKARTPLSLVRSSLLASTSGSLS